MILIKLLYLVILIILVCFWVLYVDSIALVMLLCALCLPVLLIILMLWLKFRSEASLSCNMNTSTSGESIPVTIIVNNQLPFSFSQTHAVIDLRHSFSAEKERMRLQFPLQSGNTTKMTFYIHADFCGSLDISLEKLFVLDYFHLFRTNLRMSSKKVSVLILPKRMPVQISESSAPVNCSDSDMFGDKPGDDPSEIFGIHEYIPGDPVSRIHWKLSSKSDQTLVKEFSTPVLKSVLVIADFQTSQLTSQNIMRESEAFLSLLYSLACTMIEQQTAPTILWYSTESNEIRQYTPTTLTDITEMFRELYYSLNSMKMDVHHLLNEVVNEQFSSVTCITNVFSELLTTAIDRRMNANQRNIIIISDKQVEKPSVSDHSSLIMTTPDNIDKDVKALIV